MRHHDDNTKPSQKAHARRTLTDGWAGMTGVPFAPVVLLLTSILLIALLAFLPSMAGAHPADGTDGVTAGVMADGKDDGKVDGKAGEETDGKVAKSRSNDWSDGINAADAAVLTVVFAIVTLAIKSLAKEGARRCGGNCACCGMACEERNGKRNGKQQRVMRDLSKDPVLLERIEEVKQRVGAE